MAFKKVDPSTAHAIDTPAPARRSDPPKHPEAPTGRRVERAIGPGTLREGVGKIVQRTGKPAYCGAITGRAFGYTEHANSKDASKTSVRFAGQFLAIDHAGGVRTINEAYLPSAIQSTVKAALDVQKGTTLAQPIEFAVEVWCEPAERTPLGYAYACYDRKPQAQNDPLLALAYASGMIERPASAIAAPAADTDEQVDPETGEVT